MQEFSTLLSKTNRFAVVGASDDPEKYGYRVYKMLREAGYTVYPVNPKRETVQGDKAFPDLAALPVKPEVVSVITPPAVSLKIVKSAHLLGISFIWLQPGAEDEAVLDYARKNDTGLIHGQCILVEQRRLAD